MSEIYSNVSYRVGDERPSLRVELEDNITGYAAIGNLLRPDGTSVSRAATVIDSLIGLIDFDFITGDLNQVGNFRIEFVLTNGAVDRSSDIVVFYVRESLV